MNMLNLVIKSRINLSLRSQLKIVSSLVFTVTYCSTALSATVIQNGRGLVGVINSNYSTSIIGKSRYWAAGNQAYVFLSWYIDTASCAPSLMMEIDGIQGLKFNTAGTLMLVPEVTYIDNRSWSNASKNYSDTITGIFNGSGSNTSENLGASTTCYWRPEQSTPATSVDQYITHQVTATGRMLIYGTGQQVSGTATLSLPIRLAIADPINTPANYKYSTIVNAGSYSIVVSDLGCTLSTQTLIDFSAQPANATANQALASKTVNLSVSCQQSKNPMSATLALLAGINPIYYSGDNYQVNLNNSSGVAGAYVKMNMDINGASTAIPFNRQFIDIGSITAAENATSFSYPVTYTLYSRGAGITGKVSGSAELSIVLR
ncbi:hypothetical protein [Serratia fonticola]|uniref:hypothetical protein n=1 Tax=Serratia fonticola TaxID=47917 RepID=UPI003AF36E21